jgi:hypothetical protein
MQLTSFIQDLLESGQVKVAGQLISFTDEDIKQAVILLKRYYAEDKLDMPFLAPDFSPEAAVWAALYLYHTIQFTLLRDQGEDTVKKYLSSFSGTVTPEAIYSADLLLRYLPDLLALAKGLAPDDVLVTCLKITIAQWPFSSVGLPATELINEELILTHPSLKYAYIDKIIKHKDKKRASRAQVTALIEEALGGYLPHFWPELK